VWRDEVAMAGEGGTGRRRRSRRGRREWERHGLPVCYMIGIGMRDAVAVALRGGGGG